MIGFQGQPGTTPFRSISSRPDALDDLNRSSWLRFSQCHAQPRELECEAEQCKHRNYEYDSATHHQQYIDTRTKLRHMPKHYDGE